MTVDDDSWQCFLNYHLSSTIYHLSTINYHPNLKSFIMTSRRHFIKQSSKATAALYLGSLGFSAKSYGRIIGANDRVKVGVVGFSDRFRQSLLPSFMNHYKELNFDIVAVSDIWKKRREEGRDFLKQKMDHDVQACPQ